MTFLVQQTLIYAVPLMIVALAGVFAERSGIINLALEGIMIFGAFIGVLFVRLMQGSAAVLAAVWCYFYPAAGACMVVVALLICALRVLAGAHYVRDVAAGALLGFALGAAGMWLL